MACEALEASQRAVVQALLGLPNLVTLLGHAPGNLRIGYGYPDIKGKLPFLGFTMNTRLRSKFFTRLRVSRVAFCACDSEQLTPTRISDIIICRLVGDPGVPAESRTSYFWNISGPGISVKDFQFISVSDENIQENNIKAYCKVIVADLYWMDSPCGGPLDCLQPLQ
jgi:hypothetical protein